MSMPDPFLMIDFFKGECGGNDFILVEDEKLDYSKIASELCKRHYSIGSDGLIVYISEDKGFRMEFYNPDGKRVDFCGNGALLISLFASEYKGMGKGFTFLTNIGGIKAEVKTKSVRIRFPKISSKKRKFNIQGLNGVLMDAGVPHFIIPVEKLEDIDINTTGREIAHNPVFPEYGVNVDFYNISNNYIRMRTYERGVESETLSCGSGIMAVAGFAIGENLVDNPCNVYTKGGEYSVEKIGDKLYLEGEPHIIFQGKINIRQNVEANE